MIGYNNQVYNINSAGNLKNIKILDKIIPASGLQGVFCSDYVLGVSQNFIKYEPLFPWWATTGIESDISPTGMLDPEVYKAKNSAKFQEPNGECRYINSVVACWVYVACNQANNTCSFDYSSPQVQIVKLPLATGNGHIKAQSASSVGRTEFLVDAGFGGGKIIGISATSAPSVTALSLVTFLSNFTSTAAVAVPVTLENLRVVTFQNNDDLILNAWGWSNIFAIQNSSGKNVTLNGINNINDLKLLLDKSGGKVTLNYITNFKLGNVDVLEHNASPQLQTFTAGLNITSATITGNITIHSVQHTYLTPIKNTLELTLADSSNSTIFIDGLLPDYTNDYTDNGFLNATATMIDLNLTAAVVSGQNITSLVPASIIYNDSTQTTCQKHIIVLSGANLLQTNVTNSVSFACSNVMTNNDGNLITFPNATASTNNLSVKFKMVNGVGDVSSQYENLNSLTITDSISIATTFDLSYISKSAIKTVNLSSGSTTACAISSLPSGANINVGTASSAEVGCTGIYTSTGTGTDTGVLNYNILGTNPVAATTHTITTNGVGTLNVLLNQGPGKSFANTIKVGDSSTSKSLTTLTIGGNATASSGIKTTVDFDTSTNAPTALKTINAGGANISITTTATGLPTYVTAVNTSKVGGDSITTGAGAASQNLTITIPTQAQTGPQRAQVTIKDNKTTTGVITISGYDVEGTNKDTFQFVKATALHAVNVKAGSAAADSKLTAVTAATASLTKIFSATCDGNTAKPSSVTAGQFIQCTNVFNNTAPQLSDFSKLTFSTAANTGGNDLFLLVVYAQSTPVGGNTIHTGLLRYLSDTADTLAGPKEFTEIGNFSDINDTNFDALTGTFSYV